VQIQIIEKVITQSSGFASHCLFLIHILVLSTLLSAEQVIRVIAAGREIHQPPKNASRLRAMYPPFKGL